MQFDAGVHAADGLPYCPIAAQDKDFSEIRDTAQGKLASEIFGQDRIKMFLFVFVADRNFF